MLSYYLRCETERGWQASCVINESHAHSWSSVGEINTLSLPPIIISQQFSNQQKLSLSVIHNFWPRHWHSCLCLPGGLVCCDRNVLLACPAFWLPHRANITLLALLFLIRSQINRQPITAIKLQSQELLCQCESTAKYFYWVNFQLLGLDSKVIVLLNVTLAFYFDAHVELSNGGELSALWRKCIDFRRDTALIFVPT